MPSLAEIQTTFADALRGRDATPAASIVVGDGLPPEARIAIYRHHVVASLTAAVATTYPVVSRLVGDGFFRYAAHEFIQAHPPAGPCLFEYGAGLAEFLGAFEPAGGLPYLADVARLEWALHTAAHADEFVPLDLVTLAHVAGDGAGAFTFQLDPSLVLIASPWPVDTIWQANQPDAGPDRIVDLDAGGVFLEVRRVGDSIGIRRLSPAMYELRQALLTGRPLADAVAAARSEDETLDVTETLRALFAEGVLRSFRLHHDRREQAS